MIFFSSLKSIEILWKFYDKQSQNVALVNKTDDTGWKPTVKTTLHEQIALLNQ